MLQRSQATMREIVLPRGGHARAPEMRRARVPAPREGELLARSILTGIDGTDEEVIAGAHGAMPPGQDHLVLGHECLAEVLDAPAGSGLARGDHVVPLVRHGCGACDVCARAPDMCPSDDYREHGIKQLDGFLREQWTDDPATVVKVPPGLGDIAVLTEPLSIVVKALEEARHVQQRVPWFDGYAGKRALVAGTGSLGTLGALLLLDEGMKVTAVDLSGDDAAAPTLLRGVGVAHANAKERAINELGPFDLVIEATGSPKVVFDAVETLAGNGVMVMLGVPGDKPPFLVDGADIMRRMVLKNQVLLGSVNSNKRHFEEAMRRLGRFHARWPDALAKVLSHRYAPDDYADALGAHGPDIIKKIVDWRLLDRA